MYQGPVLLVLRCRKIQPDTACCQSAAVDLFIVAKIQYHAGFRPLQPYSSVVRSFRKQPDLRDQTVLILQFPGQPLFLLPVFSFRKIPFHALQSGSIAEHDIRQIRISPQQDQIRPRRIAARSLPVAQQMFDPLLLQIIPEFPSEIKRKRLTAHHIGVIRILCQFL